MEAPAINQRRMDVRWWAAYKQVFLVLHKKPTNPEVEFSGIAAAVTDAVFKALGILLW